MTATVRFMKPRKRSQRRGPFPRRGKRWWLLLAIVLTSSVVAAPPALAANPEIGNGVCDSWNYCAYQFDAKGGSVADFRSCEPDWYCGIYDLANWDYFNTSTSINDRTSSIWNRSDKYPYTMWTRYKGGTGRMVCFPDGAYVSQATLSSLDMDNRISSMWTSSVNDCELL